ncbi:MAG: sulfatase family protein [Chitinophagaceae bacterium]
MRNSIAAILFFFASVFAIAQGEKNMASDNVRPNILWIVSEDMSLHLSCFGEKIIQTPHLDALASDGVKYTNAYTNAGVCAPSRNGIITGMYPTSIGGNNMRNYQPGPESEIATDSRPLPSYSIVPPPYVKGFPEYLRKEGYYCTNNSKEDFQFEAPVTMWDESSNKAHWRNRPQGLPFFSIINLMVTHESQIWVRDSLPLLVDPKKVIVPPYYPDVEEIRHDIASNLSNVIEMDKQAGKIIQELKDDGLYDNTIIFFYSDHGDGLPFVKREILERGLHIPLIIKFPMNAHAGKTDDQLISGVDLAPTILSLAGIPIPQYMQGQAFLGPQAAASPRKYIFAARDRMDTEVDRVRSIFDGRYQYIKNYMPEKPYYQDIGYRLQQQGMKKIIGMRDKGQLNKQQMLWFRKTKPAEELYDTKTDPHQFNNLANNPAYRNKLQSLKAAYNKWYHATGDKHALEEKAMLRQMRNGKPEEPVTREPEIVEVNDGFLIQCATTGASIGFKIKKSGVAAFPKVWTVYHYDTIQLNNGDEILVQAQRIGYKGAQKIFTYKK